MDDTLDDIEEMLENYKAWLARSRSETTIKLYVGRARGFLEWLDGAPPTASKLDQYITYLTRKGRSNNTLSTYFNSLRTFFKFLGLEAELAEIDQPRSEQVDVKCPTKEEIDKMMAAAKNQTERTLVAVQFGAGLRVGELRRIDRSDVDFENCQLTIRGEKKRMDDHDLFVIPLSKGVLREIATLLNNRDDDLEPLFPSYPRGPKGRTSKDGYLTPTAINNIYRNLCKRAGIPHYNSHALRHATTTWLLSQGVEPIYVRKLLRLKSESSMKRYDHLMPSQLAGRFPDPFEIPEQNENENEKKRKKRKGDA